MEKKETKKILETLPHKYRITLSKALEFAHNSFKENLCNITLGGSGGKGNIIENWSDLDLYLILQKYNEKEVLNFMKNINKLDIHVGTTLYTVDEVNNNLIDCKTKIMCFEKQNYNVNPTLYGKDIFKKITYIEVVENDLRNLPNVLHEIRRKYIDLMSDKNKKVTKPYIKKMLVLIKCILNCHGVFSYGYYSSVEKIKKLIEKQNYYLTPIKQFDIIYSIKNIDDSKEDILEFSSSLLKFVEYSIRRKERIKYGKKN